MQSFQWKVIILCPETVWESANAQTSAKIIIKSAKLADIKNLIGQKKPSFIWPSFKNKKSLRSWKKTKNYKFGLKKVKVATIFATVHRRSFNQLIVGPTAVCGDHSATQCRVENACGPRGHFVQMVTVFEIFKWQLVYLFSSPPLEAPGQQVNKLFSIQSGDD